MKVLFVGSDKMVCGASYSMAKLIEEEEKLGIKVIPVVRKGNTSILLANQNKSFYIVDAQSWMVAKGINPIRKELISLIKRIMNVPCYFKYKKIIRRENPDIIHVNALTTYSAIKAAINTNKPIVWHIREMIEEDHNGEFWNKAEAYRLMKKVDCFIAISKCVEEKYTPIVGKNKIKCIYNGIDKERFYEPDRSIFTNNQIVITMAGRITPEKGQVKCLEALLPILLSNSNIILQFAGDGNLEEIEKLKSILTLASLPSNQVRFLGFVSQIEQVWRETDIAVVYSKFEAFGRVTIEAKMAGCIVAGFDSGGTSELIEHGVDGFLFNNTMPLTDVVNNILRDKESARSIAIVGREKAANVFTSENNAKEVVSLYRRILKD